MSKDGPKRVLASNRRILRTLRTFSLVCLALSLALLALRRARPVRKLVALALLHGAAWGVTAHLARISAPEYSAAGSLVRVGCDLAAPGYVEAAKDLVFASAGVAVLVPLAPWLALLAPLPALVSVVRDVRGAARSLH